jgi:phage FluMu protein Com
VNSKPTTVVVQPGKLVAQARYSAYVRRAAPRAKTANAVCSSAGSCSQGFMIHSTYSYFPDVCGRD